MQGSASEAQSSAAELERLRGVTEALGAEKTAVEEAHSEMMGSMRVEAEALSHRVSELTAELTSKDDALVSVQAECADLRAAVGEKETLLSERHAVATEAASARSELQRG